MDACNKNLNLKNQKKHDYWAYCDHTNIKSIILKNKINLKVWNLAINSSGIPNPSNIKNAIHDTTVSLNRIKFIHVIFLIYKK